MELLDFKYNPEFPNIFCISLVENPAVEVNFIALSAEKQVVELKLEPTRRIVTGVILKPEQLIDRLNTETGEKRQIKFGADGIEKLAQDFFKNGYQRNANINHIQGKPVNGITYFESWIKIGENDKSVELGFNEPIGTWFMSAYVEDDNAWDMIKNGEVKGFSLEGIFDWNKIDLSIDEYYKNNNKNKKEEKMSLFKEVMKFFTEKNLVNLATISTPEGDLTCEVVEVGSVVYTAEGTPAVSVTFEYEGNVVVTDENGVIVSVTPKDAAPADVTPSTDVTAPEDLKLKEEVKMAKEATEAKAEEVKLAKVEVETLTKKLEAVIQEKGDLTTELEALKVKLAAVSAEPAATKLKSQVATKLKEVNPNEKLTLAQKIFRDLQNK